MTEFNPSTIPVNKWFAPYPLGFELFYVKSEIFVSDI